MCRYFNLKSNNNNPIHNCFKKNKIPRNKFNQEYKRPVNVKDKIAIVHCIPLYNGIPLSHKKGEILLSATAWMDLENIMLSEISQSEKDNYYRIPLTCEI